MPDNLGLVAACGTGGKCYLASGLTNTLRYAAQYLKWTPYKNGALLLLRTGRLAMTPGHEGCISCMVIICLCRELPLAVQNQILALSAAKE